jgi:hypothetical protein
MAKMTMAHHKHNNTSGHGHHPQKPTCGPSRKYIYPTEAVAKMVAARVMRRRDVGRPLRTYKCRYCNQWHLTSHPQYDC